MTTTAPLDLLADIPSEFLAPQPTRRERKVQHARLERLLVRLGVRPSYLDLHNEKVRRGLAAPLEPSTRTAPAVTESDPK